MYLIVAGIVVGVVGGILYAVAVGDIMSGISGWSQDPWSDTGGPFGGAAALLMAAYVVMAGGSVIFILGLILLVLDS